MEGGKSPSVLRVITRLNIGGPAIQALLLSKALSDRFPTTLAAGTPAPEEGELSDPLVPITRVPLVRPIAPRADLAAYRAVSRLIDGTRPALVHTHMAKAGIVGRVAARRSEAKTVHTFHGHVLEGYFSAPVQRSFIAIERWLAARTDALIAVSEEVRESLLDLGIGSRDRFHVIPLGFDLSPFLSIGDGEGSLRRELGVVPETPLIGIVGRLVAIKDHETALRAVAQIPDAHLVVIGDGDRRAEVERSIIEMGLSGRVHLLGWRNDLAACLADIDVVLLTSRNEGTPVSLIEASAAGRPVVATDVGGVRSVVVDRSTGLLATAGNDAELAARLVDVLGSPDRGRGLGDAGREHVRERFDQARLIDDIAALYDSLLGRSA